MKQILFILLLSVALIASGQTTVKHNGAVVKLNGATIKYTDAGITFEPETEAFWARTSGTMSIGWKVAYNNMIIALKDEGIWDLADMIKIYSTENAADALLDLTANELNSVKEGGAMTFTTKEGFESSGSNNLREMRPSTDAVLMAADDQTYYYRSKIVSADATWVFGTYFDTAASGDGIAGCYYVTNASSPFGYPYIRVQASIEPQTSTNFDATAYGITDISIAGTVDGTTCYSYINGSVIETLTGKNGALANSYMWSLGENQYAQADAGCVAYFVYIGKALTTSQLLALDDIYDAWIIEISTL